MTRVPQSKEACEIFESIVEAYERLFKNAPPLRRNSADKVKKEIGGQIKIASAYNELPKAVLLYVAPYALWTI